MRPLKARLQLEELESRTVLSAAPLVPPTLLAGLLSHASKQANTLSGELQGSLTPEAPAANIGVSYTMAATGTLGELGSVTVTGTFQATGLVHRGHATGQLTLTNANGTVTVNLIAHRLQRGSAPLPRRFDYTVTGGTGAYKDLYAFGEVVLRHRHHHGSTLSVQFQFT